MKRGRVFLLILCFAGAWWVWERLFQFGDLLAAETFVSGAAVSPDDGGPRAWCVQASSGAVNVREHPSTTAAILGHLVSGELLDNLGCLQAEGQTWCDVQLMGGGIRGYVAAAYLQPAVSPDGTVALGPDRSAERASQGDFDEQGTVMCAHQSGHLSSPCGYSVARAGGGYATIVLKKPDGAQRILFFRNGRGIGSDSSEADYGAFFSSRRANVTTITVGSERYEIPDAIVFGQKQVGSQ